MSEAVVDLVNRLQSSSSPSSSDKKEFTELSPNNMEAVILHVNRTIAEKLVIEIPNNQIDTVCYGIWLAQLKLVEDSRHVACVGNRKVKLQTNNNACQCTK